MKKSGKNRLGEIAAKSIHKKSNAVTNYNSQSASR